jgi:hypothetical protein
MKHELVHFARQLGISAAGDKPTLAERIAARLENSPAPASQMRKTVSRHLPEPLTHETVLPPNQAASQQLKAWFRSEIGPRFTFDIHMRTFISSDEEKTLGQAEAHWYETRRATKPETLPQLEYVRFTREWHLAHPKGTATECREAWKQHKALPIDERP